LSRADRPFRFGAVAATAADGAAWKSVCRRVEDSGCSSLLVPDHFGNHFALMPALAAAIDATEHIRVGAQVACNDYRHPVMYAKELATLDVLSGGRVDWGIGAGWFEQEYQAAGLPFDPPRVRVDRMCEAVAVMKGLFAEGACTFEGAYYSVNALDGRPKPIQQPHPPLVIGGAAKRILSFAAAEADVVGIAPSLTSRRLGELPPQQPVEDAVDEQVEWIRAAAGERFDRLELNMNAFPVSVTGDPKPDEALRAPHVWIGSPASICDELERHRARWGVSYWAVPFDSLTAVAPVIERLAGK
jgi:probable F420-dependent oxidoreductase